MAVPGMRRARIAENAMPAAPNSSVMQENISSSRVALILTDHLGAQYAFLPTPKSNLTATTDPTVDDDSTQGYSVLSRWLNTISGEFFVLADPIPGAANWQPDTLSPDELGTMAFQDASSYVPSTNSADRVYGTDGAGAQTQFSVTAPGKGLLGASSLTEISFPRVNADDSVTLRTGANFLLDLGLGTTDAPTFGGLSIAGDFETTDSLIKLASGNTTNASDLGFYGSYQPGGTLLWQGAFFDANDSGFFKVFRGLQSEPTNPVDVTAAGYIRAGIECGALRTIGNFELYSPGAYYFRTFRGGNFFAPQPPINGDIIMNTGARPALDDGTFGNVTLTGLFGQASQAHTTTQRGARQYGTYTPNGAIAPVTGWMLDQTGFFGVGTQAGVPDRQLHVEVNDAGTNTVVQGFRMSHTSSGTVAAGFGIGREVELRNASGTMRVAATEDFLWNVATNAAETLDYQMRLIKAGTITTAFTVSGLGVVGAAEAFNLPTGKGYQVNAQKVVGERKTGWATATGTATRTTFDTGTVTLPQLAERLKALIDDLHQTAGHGLIGS